MLTFGPILLFVLTLLLMGFFAGLEMAFYHANRLSLELNKKRQEKSIQIVREFFEAPDRFLGTTLLGFTLFLVLLSLQLSRVMQLLWQRFEIGNDFVQIGRAHV